MSNNINKITTRDLYVLSAAATGAAVNRANDIDELKSYLLFGGAFMALPVAVKAGKSVIWDMPKWVYKNYGNYGPALKNTYNNTLGQTNIFAANRAKLNGKFWNTVNNSYLQKELNNIVIPNFDTSKPMDIKKAEKYSEVKNMINEARNLEGKELSAKIKEIKIAEAKAKIETNKAIAAGEITRETKIGKMLSRIKTKSGVRGLQTKILKGTISANKFTRVLCKGLKSGGGMAAMSALFEAPTIIKTYKQLGWKKGTKQLGKSLVKVTAETAGFAIGTKLAGIAGAKAGALIGTAIGGPVGTLVGGAVGAIVGLAGGILGGWLFGKAARKVTGNDELEIAEKENIIKLTQEAKSNPELQMQLAMKGQEALENGDVTCEQDAKAIAQSVSNVVTALASQDENYLPKTATSQENDIITNKNEQPKITAKKTDYSSDPGLSALFSMANGKFTNSLGSYNTYSNSNSFLDAGNMNYNPFISNYNPFIGNYNPFTGNYNPFRNYYNPV